MSPNLAFYLQKKENDPGRLKHYMRSKVITVVNYSPVSRQLFTRMSRDSLVIGWQCHSCCYVANDWLAPA